MALVIWVRVKFNRPLQKEETLSIQKHFRIPLIEFELDLRRKKRKSSMPSNSSSSFITEPENSLREKLIRSIWLHRDKYCYLFEPDGSYRLLSTDRRGQYTILPDGRSVLLAWTTDPFTETLLVQEDGSLFMSGSAFIEIGARAIAPSVAPSVPPQPEVETAPPSPSKQHNFEIDTGKMPDYKTIILEGLQVRLLSTTSSGRVLSEELRDFQSEAEAEDYYHSTILWYDDRNYSPPFPAETVYLELSNQESYQFYEVTIDALTVIFRSGRIGTFGTIEKSFYKSLQEAKMVGQQKINEKLKQGYIRAYPSEAPFPTLIPEEGVEPDSLPYWLPEDFRIFTNNQGTVGTNSGGGQNVESRILPTINLYNGADGGYLAFYSRYPAKTVYSVGGGNYVMGQIRLKGQYIGRIFHPEGYKYQNISAVPEFKALCRTMFGVEGWAGGDTGGWFGLVNSSPEAIQDRPNLKIDIASFVRPAWEWVVTVGADFLLDFIRALLPWMVGLIILLSPTLLILWGAVARFGLTWRLVLIPVGGIVGFVLMGIVGAYWCNYNFELDDRRTSPPEAGSFAGLGRLIIIFIVMALLGWIGSGLGAWLVANYWVGNF